jgi:poly-gamma-glutamate capsule biosynthesis protein CapA/YwtB (metallophosphatase superfamily)
MRGLLLLVAATGSLACTGGREPTNPDLAPGAFPAPPPASLRLLLAGDVMTGRAIDQLLPHSAPPKLHERWVRDARYYVALAERLNGPLPGLVSFAYPWGDALEAMERLAPDLRMVNLETSVTRSDDHWRGKAIHYRMHPDNLPVLQAAAIDYCALANNHTLDWGRAGLLETLASLGAVGIRYSGAGRNAAEAARPAVLPVGVRGRVLAFSLGVSSSGIPETWAASPRQSGVNWLGDLSTQAIEALAKRVRALERPGDVVVVSIHWGTNWGYEIPEAQIRFAHALIDTVGVDVVHGHSSHHARGIEVYRDKLVVYGAGDLLNDYEGIGGHEAFRPDLALLYTADVDAVSGRLEELRITPLERKRMSLQRASGSDVRWLRGVLNREGAPLGSRVDAGPDGDLRLLWN